MGIIKQNIYEKFNTELKRLKEKDSFRSFKPYSEKDSKYIDINGKRLLNLSSNDYLGLSSNTELLKEFYEKYKSDKNSDLDLDLHTHGY